MSHREPTTKSLSRLPKEVFLEALDNCDPDFTAILRRQGETEAVGDFWWRADAAFNGGLGTQRSFVQRFDPAVVAALDAFWATAVRSREDSDASSDTMDQAEHARIFNKIYMVLIADWDTTTTALDDEWEHDARGASALTCAMYCDAMHELCTTWVQPTVFRRHRSQSERPQAQLQAQPPATLFPPPASPPASSPRRLASSTDAEHPDTIGQQHAAFLWKLHSNVTHGGVWRPDGEIFQSVFSGTHHRPS